MREFLLLRRLATEIQGRARAIATSFRHAVSSTGDNFGLIICATFIHIAMINPSNHRRSLTAGVIS